MVEEKKKKKLTLTASPKKPVNVPLYIQDRKKTSVIVEKKIHKFDIIEIFYIMINIILFLLLVSLS